MFKKVLAIIFALLLLLLGGFVVWGLTPLGPTEEALDALMDTAEVRVVTEANVVLFSPQEMTQTGFIFYPGGRVDYRSYAPVLHEIAAEGYLVALVRMPLSLAVLGVNRAETLITDHPEIGQWVIGGHSLGGSMAASYAYNHPEQIQGLVLWASYPAGSNDLSGYDMRVLSLSGSLDGVLNQENFIETRSLLPENTQWVTIEGGNHAQFGSYGEQPGDNSASITSTDQRVQIVDYTVMFLDNLLEGP